MGLCFGKCPQHTGNTENNQTSIVLFTNYLATFLRVVLTLSVLRFLLGLYAVEALP